MKRLPLVLLCLCSTGGALAQLPGFAGAQQQGAAPERQDAAARSREAQADDCERCGSVLDILVIPGVKAATSTARVVEPANPAASRGQPMAIIAKDARTVRQESNAPPPPPRYRVTVQMDDGTMFSQELGEHPPFARGDRVRVNRGSIVRQ